MKTAGGIATEESLCGAGFQPASLSKHHNTGLPLWGRHFCLPAGTRAKLSSLCGTSMKTAGGIACPTKANISFRGDGADFQPARLNKHHNTGLPLWGRHFCLPALLRKSGNELSVTDLGELVRCPCAPSPLEILAGPLQHSGL